MPPSSSNARSPFFSSFITSHATTYSFLTLSFLLPLMKPSPPSYLFLMPSISLLTFSIVVSSSNFLSISVPIYFISPVFSSCRLPASAGPCCLSSCIRSLYLQIISRGSILYVLSNILCYLPHQVG